MLVHSWLCRSLVVLVVFVGVGCALARESPIEQTVATNENTASPAASSTVQRDLIRTGELDLVSANIDAVRERLEQLAVAGGGHVSAMQRDEGEGGARWIKVTLRVPVDRFGSTVAAVRKVGDVTRETLGSEDVTDQRVDVDARMRSQRQLETRLLERTQRDGTLEDLLRIEQELTRVRTVIETLTAQSNELSRRVAMSSVVVFVERRLVSDYVADVAARLERAVDNALELTVMVAVAVVTLSGLVPPALMLLGVWWLARRRVRKPVTA